MSVVTQVTVRCDRCNHGASPGGDMTAAYRNARAEGFKLTATSWHETLCGTCRPAVPVLSQEDN